MNEFKRMLAFVLMLVIAPCVFACSNNKAPELNCSGVVTFMDVGLDGVTIKTKVKEYVKTNSKGEFEFNTNANSLEIYPYKAGYIFEPAVATISAGNNTVNFVAKQIEYLSGSLKLNSITIKPTSIVQSPFNYSFLNEGKNALKVKDITISNNNQTHTILNEPTFLNKLEQSTINTQDKIFLNCGDETTLGILINAYFKANYQEGYTTEESVIEFDIAVNPTNKDLQNGEGKIIYTFNNINSSNRCFTFDISFIFDFEELE